MRVRSNITCMRGNGGRYRLVLHAVSGECASVGVVASHFECHVHGIGVGEGVWVRGERKRYRNRSRATWTGPCVGDCRRWRGPDLADIASPGHRTLGNTWTRTEDALLEPARQLPGLLVVDVFLLGVHWMQGVDHNASVVLGDEAVFVEEVSEITDLADLGNEGKDLPTEVRTMFLTTAMDCCWEMVSISSRSCTVMALYEGKPNHSITILLLNSPSDEGTIPSNSYSQQTHPSK